MIMNINIHTEGNEDRFFNYMDLKNLENEKNAFD